VANFLADGPILYAASPTICMLALHSLVLTKQQKVRQDLCVQRPCQSKPGTLDGVVAPAGRSNDDKEMIYF
jgi:hypothetical protein